MQLNIPPANPAKAVPEGVPLEEKHVGNVRRANRPEVAGIMNPGLTKWRDVAGAFLGAGEIDGGGTPDTPGLAQIMSVKGDTVRSWFGMRGLKYANCVDRRLIGRVLLNKERVTPERLRRVLLAAPLIADEGLCRIDQLGNWLPAMDYPAPEVYRDVWHRATLASVVLYLESLWNGQEEDLNNLPYDLMWIRIRVWESVRGAEIAADAAGQGIPLTRAAATLLENPRPTGWYVVIDRLYPEHDPLDGIAGGGGRIRYGKSEPEPEPGEEPDPVDEGEGAYW